jgi:hypothetical protein
MSVSFIIGENQSTWRKPWVCCMSLTDSITYYYLFCKLARKSSIYVGLQEGDILVFHPLERVTIFLSITLAINVRDKHNDVFCCLWNISHYVLQTDGWQWFLWVTMYSVTLSNNYTCIMLYQVYLTSDHNQTYNT